VEADVLISVFGPEIVAGEICGNFPPAASFWHDGPDLRNNQEKNQWPRLAVRARTKSSRLRARTPIGALDGMIAGDAG
jgi:hypothetical protein